MATSTAFWEDDAGSASTYSLSSGKSPNRYHLMRILRKRGMRNYGEIVSTLLTDSTPATTAGVTVSQVDSVATPGGVNSQGGVRGVTSNETQDLLLNGDLGDASANTARAVTALDVTNLQLEVIPTGNTALRAPSVSGTITYPTDLSGNGGGGKQS
jgi:hypothetical protein